MKSIYTVILVCLFFNVGISQSKTAGFPNYTPEQEAAAKQWIDNIYEIGFDIKGDSIKVTEEAKLILQNEDYRQLIYPKKYSWEYTLALMKKSALKPAFWYLTNLYYQYPEHRKLVLQTLIPFDQLFEMDRALISSYYTYIPYDPEVTTTSNGKTTFERPDIAEAKLVATKEIIEQILHYRKNQKGQKNWKSSTHRQLQNGK